MYLIKKLGLEEVEVIIKYDSTHTLSPGQNGLTVATDKNPNKIFIFIKNNLSTGERVEALCHEMVHAEQLYDGRLFFSGISGGKADGEWEGKPFKNVTYRRSNPWEIEAHTKDKILRQKVIIKLGNYIAKSIT
jgi:hypothetical protein